MPFTTHRFTHLAAHTHTAAAAHRPLEAPRTSICSQLARRQVLISHDARASDHSLPEHGNLDLLLQLQAILPPTTRETVVR